MADGRSHFLDVRSSFTGKAWIDSLPDRRVAEAISQKHGLPDVLGRILAARGVTTDTADAFLNPTLRSALPDPKVLQDVDKAADQPRKCGFHGEPGDAPGRRVGMPPIAV